MSFKLLETHELADIKSVGKLYEHEQTGAQVLRLVNDDSNKAFTIGFRTPPYNDNGIAHILEHSVLNGSEKFPSKEPFVELLKGSMSTFVNAMTFPDRTIYPVASTNQKDFINLMEVYLDAVFQPKIYENSQILQQEGWHHHLKDAADDLIYKGVVYNEMKGMNASAEVQLFNLIAKSLYAGTPYSYDVGGAPAAIPSLTYDEFIDFHRRYYTPSNSLTVLYGDLDDEVAFGLLEEYFAKGERQAPVQLAMEMNESVAGSYCETYSIASGEDVTDKDYLALAWHVGTADDTEDVLGLKILLEVLLGNNQSPLKKALIDAGIGGDIGGDIDSIGYPTLLYIDAKYASKERMAQFKEVTQTTLRQIVQDGLDKEKITAVLNRENFKLSEMVISESQPRGIIYAMSALKTWTYGKAPYSYLEFSDAIHKLRELAKGNYFEQLIERKLLSNPYFVDITLVAEPGKNDAIELALHQQLQELKASLSASDIEELVATTQALIERQESPDKPDDLAKIPTLTKEDLSDEVEAYPLEVATFYPTTQFFHAEQFTSGIDYVNLYFDLSDMQDEDYEALSYLSKLLGKLPTNNYSVADLQTQIDMHTGGISTSVTVFEDKKGNPKPYFAVHGKALESSLDKLVTLMRELMTETQIENEDEMLTLTHSMISSFEQAIDFRAHVIAFNRAMSQLTPTAKVAERIEGIDQFNFMREVRKQLQSGQAKALRQRLVNLLDRLANKQRIHVLYVGAKERAQLVKQTVLDIFEALKDTPLGERATLHAGTQQREAFVTSQDVNYVGMASNAKGILDFTGHSYVLSSLIRLDYLWNEIRVKGGAYGAVFAYRRNGAFLLSSYRDPNIQQTLSVYNGLPQFVKQAQLSDAQMTKYIIGAMSDLEQPLSAFDKGFRAFQMWMNEVTHEERVQFKQEVLQTTQEKILALSEPFERVMHNTTIAVIGNKAQIEQESAQFDAVYELY